MNIFEVMSFDLGWFMSLPGILITLGVVLLIIALIVLLTGNKKEDKNDNVNNEISAALAKENINNNQVVENVVPPVNEPVVTNSVPENLNNSNTDNVSPINNVIDSSASNNMNNVNVVNTPVVEPIIANSNPVDASINNAEQATNTVPVTPVEPQVSINPTPTPVANVEFNPVNNLNNSNPVIDLTPNNSIKEESVNVETASVVDTPAVIETPVIPEVVVNKPSIYGGADPSTDLFKVEKEEAKPVIYGGANPLENTSTIPKIQNNIYNLPNEEVNVVEPVITNTNPSVDFNVNTNVDVNTNNESPIFTSPVINTVPEVNNEELEEL